MSVPAPFHNVCKKEIEMKLTSLSIEEGSLFIGYYGHSGWDAWSDERILSIDIINQLNESYSFPIMSSSSCTFGYFDYINRPSAAAGGPPF